MVFVFIAIFSLTSGYLYYSSFTAFEDENEKIKSSYMELQKSLLKTRVDQAYSFIQSIRRSSDAKLQETVKHRVLDAYNTATSIYEKYKNKESKSQIKQRIIDALEKLKYDDGKSYIWITDYNYVAVSYPIEPSMVGKYIGDIKDQNGAYTIKIQGDYAKKYKEGFLRDFYSKKGEDNSKKFEQITYVKDFGHFDWYFGSAVFLDEHTKKVQSDVLDALSALRFDNNYIFVDTEDGYALLMNGKKLAKPEYVLNLKDKNGVHIIKEQLKAAKSSKEGGYVEYVWYEADLGADMPHLSFCKMVDDWGWKIGSGLYVGKINDEIESRRDGFRQKILNDAFILMLIMSIFATIVALIVYAADKRIRFLFESMNAKIDSHSDELFEINKNLEDRVALESQKRVEQESFLAQQGKMAMMGEMIDTIAHQWKQPLTALLITLDNLYLQQLSGELTIEEIKKIIDESKMHIKFMGQTIDDFRTFMKPLSQKTDVSIKTLVELVETMYSKELRGADIKLEKEIDDSLFVRGYKNELLQALLNLVSNAKYAISCVGKSGVIKIKGSKKGSVAVLEIEDTGGGIDEALLPSKLFEHRVSTKGEDGSGMGLWLCSIVIKKHGGDIRAYNKKEGAVFEIILPTI